MIKFLDLKKVNKKYKDEFCTAFGNFIDNNHYVLGEQVLQFEGAFSHYCGTKFCIGVSSGLDALHLIFDAYKILGKLSDGDEVLVPANTYIASILAISHNGLEPVLVEPSIVDYNIDPDEITKSITSKTKAILGVHLYGKLYNVEALEKIAKEHNLLLIEDAAQAHGAQWIDDRKTGNVSDAAAFSFYPTKNLGALGEAGAITTNDKELAEVIFKLRNYGRISSYENKYKGYNYRIDELQAAFLNIKLKHLDDENESRREIAKIYLNEIVSKDIVLPHCNDLNQHVFHLFVVRCKNRDAIKEFLLEKKIETAIHYPIPIHQQKAYSEYRSETLPITERIHREVLSLPLNTTLQSKEIEHIVNSINLRG